MLAKRQQRTVGAIVKIPLKNGFHTYAQILPEADCAVFDARTKKTLSASEIAELPVLFRIAVSRRAFTCGKWPKVAKVPLRDEFTKPIPKFIQDVLRPKNLSIYLGGEIRRATRKECLGLECCAVWSAEHVESRIQDHYAGRPNPFVEDLKLK